MSTFLDLRSFPLFLDYFVLTASARIPVSLLFPKAYQHQPPGGSLPFATGPNKKAFVAAGIIGFMVTPFIIPFLAVRFTILKNKREPDCKWID